MKDVISDIARNVGTDAGALAAPDIPEEKRVCLRPEASPGGGEGRGATLVLRSAEFRRGREHVWRALDDMISRAEKRGSGSAFPGGGPAAAAALPRDHVLPLRGAAYRA